MKIIPMAKRMTSTDIWDKEWYMCLELRLKCLVRFMWDKCDNAGVWSPNWTLASMMIGEKVSAADIAKIDGGKRHEILPGGKIFIKDFIAFQCGDELKESVYPHKKVILLLKEHGIYNRVVSRVVNGVHSTRKEEEGDIEGYLEGDVDLEIEEELYKEPAREKLKIEDVDFLNFYELYNYKKDKPAAAKAWKKLTEKEKVDAVEYIADYVDECRRLDRPRRYPATYLNQKTWENEIEYSKSRKDESLSDRNNRAGAEAAYSILKDRGLVP